MGKIIQPRQRQYGTQRNRVLRLTEARVFAAIIANDEGEEQTCLLLQFGNSTKTGKPMVFVMADQVQMTEQLRVAPDYIQSGVLSHLSQESTASDDIPEELSNNEDLDEMLGM